MKTCRSKLAEYYKNSGTVPTSVWSTSDPVDIHEIYTRLSWVKQEQNAAGSAETELDHYCDLFNVKTSGTFPKRILVQGQTGIGKTTFVKKLAVDWAELSLNEKAHEERVVALTRFQLLLVVNLKEVSKCQSLKDVINCSNVFPEEDKSLTEGLLKYIADNQDKVFLVFDGYDEYRCGRDSDIYKIFKGDKLRNVCVLITTRISKADDLRESKGLRVLRAEILGFSSLRDICSYMKRKLGSDTEVGGLLFHLKTERLLGIAKNPLLLLFLCILWKEIKKRRLKCWPKTKTDLYVQIIQSILDYNQAKNAAGTPFDFREVNDFKEILCELGKVALECLLTDDHVFDYSRLPPSISCEESCFIGLLQVTKYTASRRPTGMVSFMHKSIQEFLSAWFITHSCVIPEGNLGPVEKHARTFEGCVALENVLQFVCGLSDKGAVKVFKHLELVRKDDPSVDLTSTVPDVEKVMDEPWRRITDRHRTFYHLVLSSFREVQSKAELSRNCFDCVGGVFLGRDSPFQLLKLEDYNSWSLHLPIPMFYAYCYREVKLLLSTLECLKNKDTGFLKVRDFVKRFLLVRCSTLGRKCGFGSIVRCHLGKVHVFIRDLRFFCFNHANFFIKAAGSNTSLDFSTLCSGALRMNFSTHLEFINCIDKSNVEEFCAIVRNCGENLGSILTNGWPARLLQEILSPVEKCVVSIGFVDVFSSQLNSFSHDPDKTPCYLTSEQAEQLAILLPQFRKTITLRLNLERCSSSSAEKLIESIAHEQLQYLELRELAMTPDLSAALGQSLPKLTRINTLILKGVSSQSVVEVAKWPFRLGKLACLVNLHLSCFNMRGNLATLLKSLHYSPNVRQLELRELNLDGNDVCALLESVSLHNPRLSILCLQGNPLGDSVTSIIPYLKKLTTYRSFWINKRDCSEEGWRNLIVAQKAHPWQFRIVCSEEKENQF